VTFGYELSIGGRPIATGETTLIALDAERRPRRIPDDVRLLLARGPAGG
jgi:acyl-CoA thioesterase FadM